MANTYDNWPTDSLAKHIGDLADEMNDHSSLVVSVAYGGEAYAGSNDAQGNPIDCTSEGIFRAIISMSESCATYHSLKEAVEELQARFAKSAEVQS